MPKATEKHGVEVVEPGGKFLAAAGPLQPHGQQYQHQHHCGKGDPHLFGHECYNNEHDQRDDEGGRSALAVAAEGDVQIVLEPVAERDVPAFPEAGGVGGFVGRIEVEREVEAHEHGYAGGDVGVAGEVGIDLEGVEEEGGEVFEWGVEEGIVENAVDKGDGEVVAEH